MLLEAKCDCMKALVLVLGLILIVSGCTQQAQEQSDLDDGQSLVSIENSEVLEGVNEMAVENGDTIKVEYVGTFPDTGEEFDKSEGRGPLEFVVGTGMMIKGFDAAVVGMALNEEKTVQIPPEDAYGKSGEGQTVEVPVEQIQTGEEEIAVGTSVFSSNGQQGKVTAITDGVATVMFEHALAGKTLQFWIKVVDIQKG
ncbi:MAG: peptidylprolyl isomerase [Candidatus Diapherotrites archaeon]|uniref:Peptidyl-prolyl cis-trans isomerase n=1 Tax=Candidatus Iainarchaeum sp. TaxID=3101447 RepID=A0A2D6LQI6_9ARCH|nr:peptidylprolyl isomerase [Candidatus Diapherotrites archaeon]|tara:strand:+ start:2520 stop:3113 length:594 start_codon:yes stop_codon:yes gene_type:complete